MNRVLRIFKPGREPSQAINHIVLGGRKFCDHDAKQRLPGNGDRH
jgi:hypothetical protein